MPIMLNQHFRAYYFHILQKADLRQLGNFQVMTDLVELKI